MNQGHHDLTAKRCVPCEGGVEPLDKAGTQNYMEQVSGWGVNESNTQIEKTFKYLNFKEAIKAVNRAAELAEDEGHHPDIKIEYDKVTFSLSTHAIGGLSENDFILAAKIDKICQ